MKSGNFEFLAFKPSASFNFTWKMSLCLSKSAFVFLRVSVILKSFSFRSDKQVLQTQINTYWLTRFLNWCSVFFFREDGNEIFTTWCFSNSYLTYFTFYLTMYTALYTFLKLGYEKSTTCYRCKLRNGKTIFRMLRFEFRKLSMLLKEIGIGCFKTLDSKL